MVETNTLRTAPRQLVSQRAGKKRKMRRREKKRAKWGEVPFVGWV